jgi:diguanylate cyclase (GGDEF)-like protein/PAS domain S-box-containing protein
LCYVLDSLRIVLSRGAWTLIDPFQDKSSVFSREVSMDDQNRSKEELLQELRLLRQRVVHPEQRETGGLLPKAKLKVEAHHEESASDEAPNGEEPPTLLCSSEDTTETIDLSNLFSKELTDSGSFDIRGDIWATTLGKLLQALPIPALLLNESIGVFQANETCGRLLQDYEMILGSAFSELIPNPSTAGHVCSLVEAVFSDRKARACEAWLGADSRRRWARMTFRSIRIMGGRYVLALVEDLTSEKEQIIHNKRHEEALKREIARRKQTEILLRESEQKYRLLVENTKEVIFVVQDGQIRFANSEALRRSAYSQEDFAHEFFHQFIHPDDREMVVERYMKRMKGEDVPSTNSFRVMDRHGNIWWGLFSIVSIDWQGKPAVLVFGTDITELKNTEDELRESEERFRSFFSNSHASMLIIDPGTGNIEDANPAACDFYGYTRKELTTMRISDINLLHPEEVLEEMRQAKSQERNYFNFRHQLANREIRDVEVYSGPIVVQGRELLYSIIHDITERKRLEGELHRLATTDSLTGAYNRQQFMNKAQEEFLRCMRYARPVSVLMIDIDHFKLINDTYGHQVGDTVLKKMVQKCLAVLRRTDVFGRLGGEEFGVVLTETDHEKGFGLAERLRETLDSPLVQTLDGPIRFTVSIGFSTIHESDASIEDVLRRADRALYKAKDRGRNCVAAANYLEG